MKKIVLFLICFFLLGCDQEEIITKIDNEKHISINYPVTNIRILDNEISRYIAEIKNDFKNGNNKELNITYTYKKINENIINVSLQSEIYNGFSTNKIKTFTYDKNTKKFLTMSDLIQDLDSLDYDIKNALIKKYSDIDMNLLNNLMYNDFYFDDDNLRIFFNNAELKDSTDEFIYVDVPLDSLDLFWDINNDFYDTYINLKKREVNYDDKIVALTFDDGPSKYTDSILNILHKQGVCATFFVIGNKVEFYDKTIVKMLKYDNEVGNHSYSHKWLDRLSDDEFIDEINKTQNAVKKVSGFVPKLFRPTYGGYTDRLKNLTDLTFVLWDVDSRDWKVKNKTKIMNNIFPYVKSGSIILMHDNHEYALEALDDVIKKLKNDGYVFVTVSELLKLTELMEG